MGNMTHMIVTKRIEFDAAHYLPNYNGKCKNLHGHRFRLEVSVKGFVVPNTGMVMDFKNLKEKMKKVVSMLDHNVLNNIIKNPTAENIILWIWEKLVLSEHLLCIESIRLWETPDCYCEARREDMEIQVFAWEHRMLNP